MPGWLRSFPHTPGARSALLSVVPPPPSRYLEMGEKRRAGGRAAAKPRGARNISKVLRGDTGAVNSANLSRDGTKVVSASDDTVRIWDISGAGNPDTDDASTDAVNGGELQPISGRSLRSGSFRRRPPSRNNKRRERSTQLPRREPLLVLITVAKSPAHRR